MIRIEDYQLFKDGKTKVHLRSPDIAIYREFAGFDAHLEEKLTTQYLNIIQVPEAYPDGKVLDSANWSDSDRRTCLYWIFMNTRDNTVITQTYECSHCKQKHGRQLDLVDLAAFMLDSNHSMTDLIAVDGIKPCYIQPLNGHAMEYLESLRNHRNDFEEDSPEWCVAHVDLRLYEVAWAIKFKDDNPELDATDQAEARFEYLMTLEPERQFKKLAAQVRAAQSNMRHGLMTEYQDGEVLLVTPPHLCPIMNKDIQEGDDPVETVLLFPFRHNHFLPAL